MNIDQLIENYCQLKRKCDLLEGLDAWVAEQQVTAIEMTYEALTGVSIDTLIKSRVTA